MRRTCRRSRYDHVVCATDLLSATIPPTRRDAGNGLARSSPPGSFGAAPAHAEGEQQGKRGTRWRNWSRRRALRPGLSVDCEVAKPRSVLERDGGASIMGLAARKSAYVWRRRYGLDRLACRSNPEAV